MTTTAMPVTAMGMTSVLHRPTAKMAIASTRCPAGVRPSGQGHSNIVADSPVRSAIIQNVPRPGVLLIQLPSPD